MPTYSAISDADVAPEAPVTTSLMTRLRDNALAYFGAPTGTKTLVRQNTAPLGWTIDTTYTDRALRVTNGTLSQGGSVAFSTLHGRTGTDAFTILQGHLPSVAWPVALTDPGHGHGYQPANPTNASIVFQAGATGFTADGPYPGPGVTSPASTGISVAVASGGSGVAITPQIDMRVAYVDIKIVTKD